MEMSALVTVKKKKKKIAQKNLHKKTERRILKVWIEEKWFVCNPDFVLRVAFRGAAQIRLLSSVSW